MKRWYRFLEQNSCYRKLLYFVPLLLLAVTPPSAGASDTLAAADATDQLIVKYKYKVAAMDAPLTAQRRSIEDIGARRGLALRYLRRGALDVDVIKIDRKLANRDVAQLAAEIMAADPNVDYAEPDYILHPAFVPSDDRYGEQWHYFEPTGGINLPLAWDASTGSGVTVAVLDTGYRPHPDLINNLLPGYDFIHDPRRANDGNGRDADALDPGDGCGNRNSSWHGTHVAGTIAAQTNNLFGVAGVAFNSRVLPVRVLGCGNVDVDGVVSDIADGIIWASGGNVPGVPANPYPARVLNLSLGGRTPCNTTIQNAINSARSRNAVVVVAAGNSPDNDDAAYFQPGNCQGVITVAAVNRSGGRANYSNTGTTVEISAPGGETGSIPANGVLSTYNTGTSSPGSNNEAFFQGTSQAAPHVAGVAALLLARSPWLTPDQVLATLQQTARPFPSSCNGCGAGIVNAAAALGVQAPPPGTPPVEPQIVRVGPPCSRSGSFWIYWTLPSGTANNYELQYSRNGGPWSWPSADNASPFVFSGLGFGSYQFRMRACSGGACSNWAPSSSGGWSDQWCPMGS